MLNDIDAKLGDYSAMPHGNNSTLADYDAMLGYDSKFGNKDSTLGNDLNLCDDSMLGDAGRLCINDPTLGHKSKLSNNGLLGKATTHRDNIMRNHDTTVGDDATLADNWI